MATSEERVADWKILVNQGRNKHSLHDELSYHLVFTKNDEEPTFFTSVGNETDRIQRRNPPGRAYDIMLFDRESLSAGEVARTVAQYQCIKAHRPDPQWSNGVGKYVPT
jgi:hypothetical protein